MTEKGCECRIYFWIFLHCRSVLTCTFYCAKSLTLYINFSHSFESTSYNFFELRSIVQPKAFQYLNDHSQITVGMSSYAGNKSKRVFNTRIISWLSFLIKSLKPNSQVPHILARVYNTNTCRSWNTSFDRKIYRFL